MPTNASGGGNCYIFKSQISLQPKLNLQISFPRQKLFSPGKTNNQFPRPGKSDLKFPFLPKGFGRNNTMC